VVVRQGSRVELPCVSSAFPLPSYTWSRRGVPINVTSPRVTQVAGNLVLDHARLEDAGDYVCRTRNQLGSRDVNVRLVVTGMSACRAVDTYIHTYMRPNSLSNFLFISK